MIAAARLDGTAVSRVVASRDLELLDLRGPGMWPALDNEVQLLGYPVDNTIYPRARDAAARLHDDQPGTDGLAWLSVRNPQATSVLLWSDSTDAPLAAAEATVLTDDHHAAVAALLLDWHAVLMHQDTRIEPDPVAAGVLGWNR